MLPAKYLRPWELLEMDIQNMPQESVEGHKYMLLIVDRASRFPFACPLKTKEAVGVAKFSMGLCITFSVPGSIRSDGGSKFMTSVVQRLCRWLRIDINYSPSNHPRALGAI